MAGFKHVRSGGYFRLDGDFNPYILSWILNSYRSIGFNSITFDLIVLWSSYVCRDPSYIKEVANALINQGKRKEEVEKEFNFKCYPLQQRQHIDLFNVCPLRGSLKLYGARLHSPRIQDLPFPDYQPLREWQIPVVQEYNCNDLDVTEQVFKFCKERLELRESISLEYNLDLMSKSDAQMAEAVISQEVGKLNGRYVKRPEIEKTSFKYRCPHYIRFATSPMQKLLEKVKGINFNIDTDGRIASPKELNEPAIIGNNQYTLGIGGLHSKDKCKAYVAKDGWKIKDIDVRSYYPNAIINLELMPIAMGPNFLTVYKGFKLSREDAKARKLFTKDKGLKIFLNGVSGKWSDPFSKMYSPWNTIHMNLTGQLLILMLAEMLTCQGMEIISANTDGLVVYYKENDEAKLAHWVKYWEEMTGFVLEDAEYKAYYARDVNAYFAVKADGSSVKVKGPYSEVGSQSGTQLDNNPIMLICSDAIKLFLASGTPIEQTIMNCRDITRFVVVRNVKGGAHKDGQYLGKVVRWAYYKKCYGTINYITSGNKVPDTEGAMPLQDLPSEFPAEQIDYQYYINAAKEILTDIGYYQRAKQVAFF